jgi:hypothetical protein
LHALPRLRDETSHFRVTALTKAARKTVAEQKAFVPSKRGWRSAAFNTAHGLIAEADPLILATNRPECLPDAMTSRMRIPQPNLQC